MNTNALSGLSNAALIAAFEAAYVTRNASAGAARQVNLLSHEISRRERMGLLTEDDWKEEQP